MPCVVVAQALSRPAPGVGAATSLWWAHTTPDTPARCQDQLPELRPLLMRGLIERVAALVPPPRTHRHRYDGVLAPNSPLRAAVTAMALAAPAQTVAGRSGTGEGASGLAQSGNALGSAGMAAPPVQAPAPEPPKRFPAHTLRAVLIARIYEVFPLVCPLCGWG